MQTHYLWNFVLSNLGYLPSSITSYMYILPVAFLVIRVLLAVLSVWSHSLLYTNKEIPRKEFRKQFFTSAMLSYPLTLLPVPFSFSAFILYSIILSLRLKKLARHSHVVANFFAILMLPVIFIVVIVVILLIIYMLMF